MPEWVLPAYVVIAALMILLAVVVWAQDEDDLRVPARLVFTAPVWPLVLAWQFGRLMVRLWCAAEWREWFRG
ncbi:MULTISPECIES: hypothetical protein [unclassified Pseudoclavibacter]|uniref:hypothetical protein n=1 Tax=unclassified Pseudoclavibacter TaxID=2615177 RepID=UPI001BAB2811|nr:hypothetical protein [Pseudoclavibacter sp. Marseille-Q4354]MBS3177735.1 hypothetical protein [Pseudoclavibacter sp. Marseille-Q4354]